MATKAKKEVGLRLGQAGDWAEDGVWLYVIHHNGRYVTWTLADDDEFRDLLEIDPERPLPRIKVGRWHSPNRNAYVRKALQKYRKVGGEIPPEAEQKILKESVAQCVLMDWESIALQDGTISAYTEEVGLKAFKQDPEFYDAVVTAALNEANHRVAAIKVDGEALGEASSGT